MRLNDFVKFFAVFAGCLALDLASEHFEVPVLNAAILPVCPLGYFFAAMSLPNIKVLRSPNRQMLASGVSLALSVPTVVVVFIYGVWMRGAGVTD